MTRLPLPAFGLLMKFVVVAALLVGVAACGAYRFPSGPAAGAGIVSGHVYAVPCAPVESQIPCKARPASGLEIIFTADDGTTAIATTDSNGAYSIELAAGTWKLRLKGYMRLLSGPQEVTVDAGASVVANYTVDSGIRVPAPVPNPAAAATAAATAAG